MARLVIQGEELVVRLSWWEKAAARRGNVHVPLRAVDKVQVEPSWWRVLRGTPSRGAWIPDVLCLGVREAAGVKDFVAIRPRRGPVACLDLHPDASPFARVAVSDRVPEATAATVRTAVRRRASAPRPARLPDPDPDPDTVPAAKGPAAQPA
ncbi:hypothetical protein J7E93_27400 [Streptomyces sp. ISL-36]|uniref:hypothetical protein n=1 Tax=Streptomyces sp. ISL-36 TaxID=2819182 RepID=UPI001BEACE76|nr:hypothetical protein [Streptomyces sp. ISL-36]MBT2443758.1 hypothetical protein [Streptomyces sp. ISL-36]